MLKEYEREMREPTGIYVQQPPNGIQIEGVAIFDECGGGLWVDGWSGDRVSCYVDRLVYAVLIFLVFAELMLSGTNPYTVSIC